MIAGRLLPLLTVGLGIVMAGSAIARGGGPLSVGVVVGLLFCAAGAGRLYVELRR